jgi:hypothetical protein
MLTPILAPPIFLNLNTMSPKPKTFILNIILSNVHPHLGHLGGWHSILGHPTKNNVSNFSFEAYFLFSSTKDIISQCFRNIQKVEKRFQGARVYWFGVEVL